jgi:hypothetical protein
MKESYNTTTITTISTTDVVLNAIHEELKILKLKSEEQTKEILALTPNVTPGTQFVRVSSNLRAMGKSSLSVSSMHGMKGWIKKQPTSVSLRGYGNPLKGWKTRFMVLDIESMTLMYGEKESALCTSHGIKGTIALQKGMICKSGSKMNSFELCYSSDCVLRALVSDDYICQQWISSINTVIESLLE